MKTLFISMIILCVSSTLTQASTSKSEELMDLMGVKKQMLGGLEAMLPVIDQMASEWGLDEQGRLELLNIYRDWFTEDIDQDLLVSQVKELYDAVFTEAELEYLIKFYSSEVGKKVIEMTPELTKRGAALGMQEAQSKEAELMARLQPFLKKQGIQ